MSKTWPDRINRCQVNESISKRESTATNKIKLNKLQPSAQPNRGQWLRVINNYRDYAVKCTHPDNMWKEMDFRSGGDPLADITGIHLPVGSGWRGTGRRQGVKAPPWGCAVPFNFYFPLKWSFNASRTLLFQKINIRVEEKNSSPKLEGQQISSKEVWLYTESFQHQLWFHSRRHNNRKDHVHWVYSVLNV